MIQHVRVDLGELPHAGEAHFELNDPGLFIAFLSLILMFRFLSMVLLLPREIPAFGTKSFRQQLKTTAHPRAIVQEIKAILARSISPGAPVKSLAEQEVSLRQDERSGAESGRVSGMFLLETRPERSAPSDNPVRLVGWIHSLSGAVAIFGGLWHLTAFRNMELDYDAGESLNLAEPLVVTFTAMLLFTTGSEFLENAKALFKRSLFRSKLCLVEIAGKFSQRDDRYNREQGVRLSSQSPEIMVELAIDYAFGQGLSESTASGTREWLELRPGSETPPELAVLENIAPPFDAREPGTDREASRPELEEIAPAELTEEGPAHPISVPMKSGKAESHATTLELSGPAESAALPAARHATDLPNAAPEIAEPQPQFALAIPMVLENARPDCTPIETPTPRTKVPPNGPKDGTDRNRNSWLPPSLRLSSMRSAENNASSEGTADSRSDTGIDQNGGGPHEASTPSPRGRSSNTALPDSLFTMSRTAVTSPPTENAR